MDFEIVGIKRLKGSKLNKDTGEQRSYDITIFNVVYEAIDQFTVGKEVKEISMQSKFVNDDPVDLIGHYVTFQCVPGYNNRAEYVGYNIV